MLLLRYKHLLINKLSRNSVTVRVVILALEEYLANKITRIGTAVEATFSCNKVKLTSKRLYSSIVVRHIICYKLANLSTANAKL